MIAKIFQFMGLKRQDHKHFESRLILIVDDNEMDARLIQRTVEKMGHRAIVAGNGKKGLEMAKAHKPDLILSDCRMPEMDGLEMCRQLKRDEATQGIPFVFLTSHDSPSMVVECFDMEVENYLCKPIDPKLLMSQIQAIFKEHFGSDKFHPARTDAGNV